MRGPARRLTYMLGRSRSATVTGMDALSVGPSASGTGGSCDSGIDENIVTPPTVTLVVDDGRGAIGIRATFSVYCPEGIPRNVKAPFASVTVDPTSTMLSVAAFAE